MDSWTVLIERASNVIWSCIAARWICWQL